MTDTETKPLPDEYREFCETQYQTARQLLEKDGHVLAIFFVRIGKTDDPEFSGSEGGFITIPLLCDDKDLLATMVHTVALRANSPFVVNIAECWVTMISKEGDSTPVRKEAVMISAETSEGSWMCTAEITRDSEGKPHIPETMPEMNGGWNCGGRFSGMVPAKNGTHHDPEALLKNAFD